MIEASINTLFYEKDLFVTLLLVALFDHRLIDSSALTTEQNLGTFSHFRAYNR